MGSTCHKQSAYSRIGSSTVRTHRATSIRFSYPVWGLPDLKYWPVTPQQLIRLFRPPPPPPPLQFDIKLIFYVCENNTQHDVARSVPGKLKIVQCIWWPFLLLFLSFLFFSVEVPPPPLFFFFIEKGMQFVKLECENCAVCEMTFSFSSAEVHLVLVSLTSVGPLTLWQKHPPT